ncbi:MAG: TetR/AcrR family transcriptional regulator [Candidatus Dadabacteria bacterium]|nr:TetR/AcrR family transcriptional regulator [Candidatus Dadabacteria bacterium]MYC40576.1 TetR/AcrR family transcriptional regulator [Candidatus Dadabacteria bacterium]
MVQATSVPERSTSAAKTSRKFRRRGEILRTATDLFSEKGYHELTMEEIAEEIGVSKGTIYNYFSSKENLYLEILKESFEAIETLLQKEIENSDPAPAKLRKLLATIFTFYRRNLKVLRILSRDETHLLKEHFELTEKWRMSRVRLYERIIEKGIDEGSFVRQNPRLRALMLYGAVGAVMVHHDFSMDAGEVADAVFSQLASGLLVKTES